MAFKNIYISTFLTMVASYCYLIVFLNALAFPSPKLLVHAFVLRSPSVTYTSPSIPLSPYCRHPHHRHGSNHHSFTQNFLAQSSSSSPSSASSSSVQNSTEDETLTTKPHPNIQPVESKPTTAAISATCTSSTSPSPSQNQTKKPATKTTQQELLYEEANKLREKAKELLQEAAKEEQQLKTTKRLQRNNWNMNLDDIIDDFISLKHDFIDSNSNANDNLNNQRNDSSTTPATAANLSNNELFSREVMQLILKKGLSTTKLINIIERIHEREMKSKRIFMDSMDSINSTNDSIGNSAATATATSSFTIGDMTNSKDYNQNQLIILQGWIDHLIHAQNLIDEEKERKMPNDGKKRNTPSSSTSSRMNARFKQLKKEEDELYQRQLTKKLNQGLASSSNDGRSEMTTTRSSSSPTDIQSYIKNTLNEEDENNLMEQNVTIKIDGRRVTSSRLNITNILADIAETPMWVPTTLLPYLVIAQDELNIEDLKKIKSNVLLGSQFQCTSWDSTRIAAIYRGNLMEKERASSVNALSGVVGMPNKINSKFNKKKEDAMDDKEEQSLSTLVFHDIQQRLVKEGLGDKIQLFIMEDPEWRPGQDSRQLEPQPVIIAVSSTVAPDQGDNRGKAAKFLIGLSIISTIFTTFAYSISTFALNPTFFNGVVNESNIRILSACLPIFFGVFVLSAFHELAHFLVAKRRGVKIGLPIPLPSFQIGTFGSITPLRSFPQSRAALFDVAISGPLLTSILSSFMVIGGIFLTISTPADSIPNLAVIPAALMKMSFLVGSITSIIAPKVMMLPLSQPIPIHPLFLAGFAGLVSSALNMLPVGRLDGGRTFTAIFGRRPAYVISLLTLILMAIGALSGFSTISIFWGLLISLFQRNADVPVRDELSEVDDIRFGVYIFSMIVTFLTLAPFPGVTGAL